MPLTRCIYRIPFYTILGLFGLGFIPTICSGQSATGYWAVIIIHDGYKTYDGSNVFASEPCNTTSDRVPNYVQTIIGQQPKNSSFLKCYTTRQQAERETTPPPSYTRLKYWNIPDYLATDSRKASNTSNSDGVSGTSQSSDSDADERTRLFNQQKGRTTVVNPDGTTSSRLVQRSGESDEDFRARERNTFYEAQNNVQRVTEDGRNDGTLWTVADGKKYTKNRQGHWEVGTFRATAWCADAMFMATGYVDACVVNEKGSGSFKGNFLEVRNSSSNYPVYYGLSGVINKMVVPGGRQTEDLHMYRAIDPAKRAKEPDTVVEITVKYWVEKP